MREQTQIQSAPATFDWPGGVVTRHLGYRKDETDALISTLRAEQTRLEQRLTEAEEARDQAQVGEAYANGMGLAAVEAWESRALKAEAEQTRLREALEAAVRGIDDVAAQASLCAHHVVPTEQQRTWLRSEVSREAVAVQRMIRAALSSTPTPETTP
jgi:predicted  nucleic acid-binding Zn-ribbon protein